MEDKLNTTIENSLGRPMSLNGTPFAWQDARITKFIRSQYEGKRRTTALALYQTMTDFASNQGRIEGKPVCEFPAYLEKIADKTGKSVSTIRRYFSEFRSMKILAWQNRKNGKMNLCNIWKLLRYVPQYHKTTSLQDNEHNPSADNKSQASEELIRTSIEKKGKFIEETNRIRKALGDKMRINHDWKPFTP